MRSYIQRESEKFALIRRESTPITKLAVFIHGFRGSYLQTWGTIPDKLYEYADTHPIFSQWDYLFLGYETAQITSYLDIARRLNTEILKALEGTPPFAGRYTKLSLFGHSLGTLGIRQLLCTGSEHSSQFMSSLHTITFFGTPLNGSPLASFAFGYPIRHALKPANPQLRMLHAWHETVYPVSGWPPVQVILGEDDQVVGLTYGGFLDWPGDHKPFHYTMFDHGDLVKPKDWASSAVVDYLITALK